MIRPSAELVGVYYVKDPLLDSYFEANSLQYEILSRLDGTHSLDEIGLEVSKKFEMEITASDLEGYLLELDHQQLLDQPGADIRSDELRREVGRRARSQLRKQGFSLDDRAPRGDGRRTPNRPLERTLFSKALVALAADEISAALRHFGAILDLNPRNVRARLFRRVIRESLIKTRQQHRGASAVTEALRFRLYSPDRLLAAIDRRAGRLLFSWGFVVTALALFLAACYVAVLSGATLYRQIAASAGSQPVLFAVATYLCFVASVFVHEHVHGLACKHYGGTVRSTGFMFVSVLPAAYCDVSDTYFLTRRQRIVVLSAGLIGDGVLWSWMLLLWRFTEPGTAVNTLASLFLSLYSVTILADVLPFIKNDGYYLVAAALGISNLYDQARLCFRAAAISLFSGYKVLPDEVEPRRRMFLLFFHSAMVLVRLFLLWGLIPYLLGGYLIGRLRGWGLLLLLAVLYVRFLIQRRQRARGTSFFSAVRRAIAIDPYRFWRPAHLATVFAAPLALLTLLLLFPWEVKLDAPAHLEAKNRAQVRSREGGRAVRVRHAEGDWVAQGDVVVELDREELLAHQRQVRATLAAVNARLRIARAGTRRERLAVLRRKVERLATEVGFAANRYERLHQLARTRAVSSREADGAKGDLAVKESQHAQALAELRKESAAARPETITALEAERARYEAEAILIARRLAGRTLRSPIAGTILTPRMNEIEQRHLKPGEIVCEVADLSVMEAVLLAKAQDLKDLRKGALVKIKILGLARATYYCRVHHIAEKPASFEGAEGRFEVRCLLPGDSRRLAVALTGKSEIFAGRRRVIDIFIRPIKRVVSVDFWSLF